MSKVVIGQEALELLDLLERLDAGEPLTPEIQRDLSEITVLDLPVMLMKHLPSSIENLTNLERLYISGNKLIKLPDTLGNLTNLQKLDISDNKLTGLPDTLGNLTNLQKLNISDNKLTGLPDTLGNLTNLQILDISHNELTEWPKPLGNLTNLLMLDISHNELTELTDDTLRNLTNLWRLDISGNKLTELPDTLGNLTNLLLLNISSNKLTELRESLGNLTNLQELDISENELTELPDTLGNLTNLERLYIDSNKLTKLDKLRNLTNLQELYISSTKIRTIPAWVGSLKQLKKLNLSGLNLHSLPPDILDLDLPFNFSGYIFVKGTTPFTQSISLFQQPIDLSDAFVVGNGIFLKNTTLSTQPISLFQQPRELIKAYFDSEKIPVHEAKVIFLGDGGAGKTRTICRIKNGCKQGEYNTQMTPGVEITSFQTESEDLTLNFWDFGGQEIMPSIHRCFLTQRALYVIVVSTRTGNITVQARHWLKTIDAFAPGAPVLIAVNCWENTVSRGVNNEMLYEEFPNLLDTVIFSAKCSTKEEFYQNLLRPIEEHAGKLDSCSMELPESWLHIKQALRDQTEHCIDGEKYLKICRDNGLEDEQIAQWLLEWFNDLGVCFSYSDGSGRPYQVLRPEWLTNAVYRILLDESGPDSDGTVRRKHIEKSLASSGSGTLPDVTYNEKECSAILAVMKEFRLAYSTGEDERELFIPALCTQKMPDLSFLENFEQRVEYELQYAYLPDCVLHQLMIWYMENGVKPKYVWYRGLCVQVHTRWAEITGDFQHDKLCIRLYMEPDCSAPNCHDMLRDIYQEIQKINSRLALEAADSIVMHSDNQTAHFPLGPLLKAKQSGCEELTCLEDGEFHVYNIDKILDSVFEREQVQSALEQNRRNDLSGVNASAIYSSCNFTYNIDSHDTTNSWTAEDATKFYNAISENHRLFTEEVVAKLIDALIEQNDAALKNLGKEMAADKSAKKSPLERLKDFIGNAAKLGKDIQTLCQLAKAIGTAVPALSEFLGNLL